MELKGKRLVYKQPAANFKTANRREMLCEIPEACRLRSSLKRLPVMLRFQEALLQAEDSSQRMEQLPEDFYPLVVSAGTSCE